MNRTEKQTLIDTLHKEFGQSPHAILVDYKGLTVPAVTEFRRKVRASGSAYRVVKNSLALRATKGTPLEKLAAQFDNMTGVAYTGQDPVALAKAITTYAKSNPLFVFKAGVVEGRVVNLADLDQIATLPSKEELVSKLMFLLNSQAQRIASVVSAVREIGRGREPGE
jgi:large subunit ribosomal protein L10